MPLPPPCPAPPCCSRRCGAGGANSRQVRRTMGAATTRIGQQDPELVDRTGFSPEQINNLHKRFLQLSGNKDTISRENLNDIPALTYNPIKSQIIEAFFDKRNQHDSEVGSLEEITFEQFLMVMSHFRPPTLEMTAEEKQAMRKEKLRFLFNMHDTDGDGKITLEEYRKVVEELLSSGSIEQESAKEITDAAMLEVASTNVPHMGPEDFYEGITFEHFEQILKGLEMESRMHIRFLDTATVHCGKS